MSAPRRLRIGIAGLGRAFTLTLPALRKHPRVQLVAAADPREDARRQFERDFGGKTYADVEGLCADPDVEAVYIATPLQAHAAHTRLAAGAGKHVLVEKPMAPTIADADAMAEAVRAAGVQLVVGPSHSFDAPIRRAREIVASGELGRLRMMTAVQFTDFLYRPRRPEELDSSQGGGVLLTQAAHHVDIVRLLGGGMVETVRAHAGAWDRTRPVDGAYAALLSFGDGTFASLAYNGYGHFSSDELCGNVSEIGREKGPSMPGAARRALVGLDAEKEAAAKAARNYGGSNWQDSDEAPWHEHFGFLIVSCERGDIRPTPKGLWVHGAVKERFEKFDKPAVPRGTVLDELCDAIESGRKPLHDAAWGLATIEVCLAMQRSAREGIDVRPTRQVPA